MAVSVCYVTLSCEKYMATRVAWQKKHCKLPNQYVLSATMDPENKVYGWVEETGDAYESCPLKYISFFRKVDDLDDDFDWFVFIDDDTFVFHDRLVKELEQYDKSKSLYVGNPLHHIPPMVYMAGGCGFVLSKSAFKSVKDHVRNTDAKALQQGCRDMFCGDVCMGWWVRTVGTIESVFNRNLCYDHYDTADGPFKRFTGQAPDVTKHATFHFLKTEEHYAHLAALNTQ